MNRFGHAMRVHWILDPEVIYLNHGTVGATPRVVLEEQQKLRDEVERRPSHFMLREIGQHVGKPLPGPNRVRAAAGAVGQFLGVRGEDLVFVDNATTGINAVLRSFPFKAGDEILLVSHAYGAVLNAAQYRARECGAKVVVATMPKPTVSSDQIVSALGAVLSRNTRLAIIDHITSESALLLPIVPIIQACRSVGATILIDGAHAPGAIELDIESLGVDWYVGNLHKWAYAPRGCGILWSSREKQSLLHPAVISWGLDKGFNLEFDWVGTKDPTNYLAAPAGINFLRSLGERAVREYNHRLAWEGAQMLCQRFGTRMTAPEEMIGCMATWPLPSALGSTKEDAATLRDYLLFDRKIEAQIHAANGNLWMRISGQVYNEMSDLERFAEAVEQRL